MMATTICQDTRSGRLRARTVDAGQLERVATRAAVKASQRGKPTVRIRHGGDVANCYGYPAYTETVVAVAIDAKTVGVWAAQVPANKVTFGGCLEACIGPEARPLFDLRFGKKAKAAAKQYIVTETLAQMG